MASDAYTFAQTRHLAKMRVAAQRDSEALTRAAAAYEAWGTTKLKRTARLLHEAAGRAQEKADWCRAHEARLRAEREGR